MAAVVGGESPYAVARRLGIAFQTVHRWALEDGKIHPANARTREELSALVYDAVAETLRSLTARARVTGDTNWIKEQSASQLAELADAEWDRIIRMVAAFQPRPDQPELPGPDAGPESYRNGAVDSPG